jgi:hypothetical protein
MAAGCGLAAPAGAAARPMSNPHCEPYSTTVRVMQACWDSSDKAVRRGQGRSLRKGPRGGGRELKAMVEHVLGADEAYLSRLGWKCQAGGKGEGKPGAGAGKGGDPRGVAGGCRRPDSCHGAPRRPAPVGALLYPSSSLARAGPRLGDRRPPDMTWGQGAATPGRRRSSEGGPATAESEPALTIL